MINIKLLRYIFEKPLLLRLLLFASFVGLLTILDFVLLAMIGPLFGSFLVLSFLTAFSGFGLLLLIRQSIVSLDDIGHSHKKGYSEEPFYSFIGLIPSLTLLIIPGAFTTFLGMILLIMPIRKKLGHFLSEKFSVDWEEIYEYFYILYK